MSTQVKDLGWAGRRRLHRTGSAPFDAVIVGSGVGGALLAHGLVRAGWRVLMVERGIPVRRGPHLWEPEGAVTLSPYYSTDTAWRVRGEGWGKVGAFHCVGGPSVFYGAASFRLREADFEPSPGLHPEGARWPLGYREMEPWYTEAERVLGVAGAPEDDPTEPFRSAPYPQAPSPLCGTSRRIRDAASRLGMHPSRIPVAINYAGRNGRTPCALCDTCDGYACAIDAKNDPAGAVLPGLVRRGLTLRSGTAAVRVILQGRRVSGVECVERESGRHVVFQADHVILSAGALASPQLLLASGLQQLSPAPQAVGRFLLRHCNAMVFGLFPDPLAAGPEFRKQVAIHDFYFGDPEAGSWAGKLGSLQQVQGAPEGLVADRLPPGLKKAAPWLSHRITGLLAIAEDEPRIENRVTLDRRRSDPFGLPGLRIHHRYTNRDRGARWALIRRARSVLREAGASLTGVMPIRTFSHAVGTLRMGEDPWTSPLDPACRFRGIENLFVVDGSFMPTSGGVNPSLTIAANALRVAHQLHNEAGGRSLGAWAADTRRLVPFPEAAPLAFEQGGGER